MIFSAWDVVIVPFPFVDRDQNKRRPALVLSAPVFNRSGRTVLAMITSSTNNWPADVEIGNLPAAGLKKPCKVRMNLFTLDNRLILNRIGQLHPDDRGSVLAGLRSILPSA